MKKVLLGLFLFLSVCSFAQETYDASISFNMTDSTDEAGSIYKRKGFLHSFCYYQPQQILEVFVRVRFYNGATELKRFAPSYTKSFTITNNVFVVSATGTVVGDREAMRALYGVVQKAATDSTPIKWRQSVFGGDSLTTPCIGQYDYVTKLFDNNNKANTVIKNLAQAAAGEGKLN